MTNRTLPVHRANKLMVERRTVTLAAIEDAVGTSDPEQVIETMSKTGSVRGRTIQLIDGEYFLAEPKEPNTVRAEAR